MNTLGLNFSAYRLPACRPAVLATAALGVALGVLAVCVVPTWAQYRGGWGSYSSTAAEGQARGMADVVRSAGQANLMNSAAARNYEEARSRALDNRLKNTSTYFQARAENRAARAAEESPPLTSEQLFRIAHRAAPKALTTQELDPFTGTIDWPILLRDESFLNNRASIEQLFGERAREGRDFSYQTLVQIQTEIDAWIATLSARIKEYRPQDFIEAKRFLESLSHQARKTS